MTVSQRPAIFLFVERLIVASITKRLSYSLGLRHVVIQSPIWISDVSNGSNHPRFVPHPHSAFAEPENLLYPPTAYSVKMVSLCSRFAQALGESVPLLRDGFADPLRLATGQPRFK